MYRLLNKGEVILSTDEFFSISNRKWIKTNEVPVPLTVLDDSLPIRRLMFRSNQFVEFKVKTKGIAQKT